jgi:hypothetical protein
MNRDPVSLSAAFPLSPVPDILYIRQEERNENDHQY